MNDNITVSLDDIEKAKDRLNGWGEEYCIRVIADAFLPPEKEETQEKVSERLALRKVIAAGGLDRQFNGWAFWLPRTRDVFKAEPGKLTISGKLCEGTCSDDPDGYGYLILDMTRMTDLEYLKEVSQDELGRAFLRALYEEVCECTS